MTVEEAMLSSSSPPSPAGLSYEPEPVKGVIVQRFCSLSHFDRGKRNSVAKPKQT